MSAPASETQNQVVNGVNVTKLEETIGAIQETPTLARFQFRNRNRWLGGGHNRSHIKEFYGAGEEDTTRSEPFVLDADEPPVLLGEDTGANPVEYLLHALAACLTTSLVVHAAARGIEIEEVESRIEGDLDVRGFLGLSDDVRKGYQGIRVSFRVKSDASGEQLRELAEMSPVRDVVSNGTPVSVDIDVR
jgi:uncharacterized OsmC-like protein